MIKRNKLCGATRLSDGTHVVLQLLAIGDDGKEELKILHRLHKEPISTTYPNRAVPLLDMLTYAEHNMVFGVFPLVGSGIIGSLCPGYRSPAEAISICRQWIEVSLHMAVVFSLQADEEC